MSSAALKRLALVACFTAGLYQVWTHRPFEVGLIGDDQLYYFVAERAASGVPPHVSLVDHKHQLTALISAIPIRIGRSFGADDVVAGRVASAIAAAGTVVLLFLWVETLTASAVAGALAAAVTLSFRMYFTEAAMGFRPQLFMAFFATAALLAFARRRHVTAGALGAASFLCWQPAGLIGASLVFATLGDPGWKRAIARIAAGAMLVVAVYEAYFLFYGALGEQLRQSYLMASTGERVVRPLAESLVFIVSGDPRGWGLRPAHIAAAGLLAGLAGAWLFALLRMRSGIALWRRDAGWRAAFLAAHGAIAFTLLDHQAYPDQFFILPFAAVAAGTLAWLAIRRLPSKGIQLALAAVALAWIVTDAFDLGPRARPLALLSDQRALAKRMVDFADSRGGALWVVGRPELLALERRSNWSPFGMLLDRRVREYATRALGSRSIRPLRDGKMPDVMVLARLASNEHLEWVRHEYQPVLLRGFETPRLRILVRKTPQSAQRKPPAMRACGDPVAGRPVKGKPPVGNALTASDALHVLRASVKVRACPLCVCDTDRSGALTPSDALRVLVRAAGRAVSLRCPACPAPRPAKPKPKAPAVGSPAPGHDVRR